MALHMDGLRRIINLRGGLDNLATINQFGWKVKLYEKTFHSILGFASIVYQHTDKTINIRIDLIIAAMGDSQEKLPPFQPPRPHPPLVPNPSLSKFQIPDSPLLSRKSFKSILSGSPFCARGRKLLLEMRMLTDPTVYNEEVEGFGEWSSTLSPTYSSLSRTIYFTSDIYRRALGSPSIPFTSPLNETAIKEISLGLEDIGNDETWIRYPGILLWILLTASSATVARGPRGFFVMLLFRVGISAVWWGTEEAREALLRFADVKRRANGLLPLKNN
jgi:hypothetical protein